MNIIVVSYVGSPWLQDCLESIKNSNYPIYVAMNSKQFNNYETAGLILGQKLGEDFILIHDSCIIKDLGLFDMCNDHIGAVSFGRNFFMLMGKYNWASLKQLDIPVVNNKQEAVDVEHKFGSLYCNHSQAMVLFPDFTDTNIFEDKYGKKRMVLENQYIKKWKNCWSPSMVVEADIIK